MHFNKKLPHRKNRSAASKSGGKITSQDEASAASPVVKLPHRMKRSAASPASPAVPGQSARGRRKTCGQSPPETGSAGSLNIKKLKGTVPRD